MWHFSFKVNTNYFVRDFDGLQNLMYSIFESVFGYQKADKGNLIELAVKSHLCKLITLRSKWSQYEWKKRFIRNSHKYLKMECLLTILNAYKPLTVVTKPFIFDTFGNPGYASRVPVYYWKKGKKKGRGKIGRKEKVMIRFSRSNLRAAW